jgi:hypothetical protein
MQFQHWDLGWQDQGRLVEVVLSGSAANVRLMDSSNLSSYRSGRQHRYYGGLVNRSPWRHPIPHSGRWHVTVDMQGLRGSTRASVRVVDVPSPLPPARQPALRPLRDIGLSVGAAGAADGSDATEGGGADVTNGPAEKAWDVFISHATEDKEAVVRPLAHALQARGLRVWYDEFELRLGDSLRRKIDNGLAKSKFGVVVLSPAFFAKNWPQYELDGFVMREMTGQQVILPLWHHISKDEILAVSPSLADKVARRTSDATIDELAEEIAQRIQEP